MTNRVPFGSWPSPISAADVAASSVRLSQPRYFADKLFWLETRPDENARRVIVIHTAGETQDLLPAPYSAHSRAHEYGGGDYVSDGKRVWFANDDDQAIYVLESDTVERLTEPGGRRYADLLLDAERDRLIAVSEDHTEPGEAKTTLVTIGLRDGSIGTLAEGADFYSSPALSPDGRHLAWLSWNHPNLPWDETRLFLASITSDGSLGEGEKICQDGESVFQPEFDSNGTLHFVSDRDEWWNIYRRESGTTKQITRDAGEFGRPQWVFGMRSYSFCGDRIAATRTESGRWNLSVVTDHGVQDIGLPFTVLESIDAKDERVVLLAASPTIPPAIVEVRSSDGSFEIIRASSDNIPSEDVLSIPEHIEYQAQGNTKARAFFYAPKNDGFSGKKHETPPLLVKCHGGPTASTDDGLDLRIQYWTSRGFAVLDVNYRGSTGYGRPYRRLLYGQWGIADVEDCVAGVRHLVDTGQVDADRVAISGSSAGGFTVLRALSVHDVFHAGASYYGVADAETLLNDTHKFETRYCDQLIGPYPEMRNVYRERSPVNHPDRLRCPVIFFQGLKDKVVPPSQTRCMTDALRRTGVPMASIEFEEEGHGFRHSGNIRRALEAEYYFYSKMFGFKPNDDIEPVAIENF